MPAAELVVQQSCRVEGDWLVVAFAVVVAAAAAEAAAGAAAAAVGADLECWLIGIGCSGQGGSRSCRSPPFGWNEN